MDGGRRQRGRRSDADDGLADLDVTREELDGIGEALKHEEFRKLLCEYVDEITDPENRARREREIEQYERERGAHVTFVRPRAGYVLKTSADGSRKVFVNVCSCETIGRPEVRRADGGDRWTLPHCLSPARRDYDRARRPCDVYDVVFHPDALGLASRGPRLRDMVEDTALSMVEKTHGVALDRVNVKRPKCAFKGVVRSLMVRKRIEGFRPPSPAADDCGGEDPTPGLLPQPPSYRPPPDDRPVQHHDLGALKQKSTHAVPAYVIKYRSDVDIQEHGYGMHCKMNAAIPKELIVEVHMPLLDSSADVQLDVLPRSLRLVCHKPSKYKLDVDLPYTVLEDDGGATFDQSTRKLIVRLPVLRTDPPLGQPVAPASVSETVDSEPERVCPAADNNDSVADNHPISEGCGNQVDVPEGRLDENMNNHNDDTKYDDADDCKVIANDSVHYILPEHEFIFDNKCILTLNVKNVDPTSINVEFINDKNLISGKFHSVGSGYFPIWFAFCLQIPSQSRFLKSDVKVLPSDDNIVIEFFAHLQSDCKDYWYGLDRDNLIVQHIRIEKIFKENINALANGVSITLNDSDEDGDDDDVFDDKEENESKNPQLQNIKKSNDNFQSKDKNGKTIKEKGRKKKGKKIQKSNAIPIAVARSLPESVTKTDFIPGSLPIELNNIRPTIRGILKKRSLSECSTVDEAVLSPRLYSSSVDNVDTENSDVQESSFNDCKKTVRFNDHVIEKKINFNISIAAQAKKHRQRQQRKRNIREYNTPSESEASEAEDKIYGPLNVVSESEETSVSESSTGEMSDDSSNELTTISSKITVVADSKKDHKRRKSKSARKNASLAKQASTNNLIFPIEY